MKPLTALILLLFFSGCETVPSGGVDIKKVEALSNKKKNGVKSIRLNKVATELACGKGSYGCIINSKDGPIVVYMFKDWVFI